MTNPITDGRLVPDNPSWRERFAAAIVVSAILFAAHTCGVLSWPRVRWLLPSCIVIAAICVWFPEFVAGLLSISSGDGAPPVGIRVTGWAILVALAVVVAILWLSLT
jgi:hypothetical protein